MCDEHFSEAARAVLADLRARQGDAANCDISASALAFALPCGRKQQRTWASSGIRELVAAGVVTQERRPGFASRFSVRPREQVAFADPEVARAFHTRRELVGKIAMFTRRVERIDAWLIYGDADRAGPPLDVHGRPPQGQVKNS